MVKLASREQEVYDELAHRVTIEVAALNLGMKPATVSNYKYKIRRKVFAAAKFLKKMQRDADVIDLKILVKVEDLPRRRV